MRSLKKILLTVFAIAVVVLLPHVWQLPVPFGYSIIILVLIWLFLKQQQEDFSSLGFSFKRFEIKSFVVGTITGIALFIFLQYAFFPLLSKIVPLSPANLDDFKSIKGNTGKYVFILMMGWIIGGVYEEIVFHGFVFTQLEKIMKGNYALVISVSLTAIIFAFYHFQLGVSGMINAGLAGLAYHLLMLRYKRNMWYAVFCHAAFDTIGLTYIYLGYW